MPPHALGRLVPVAVLLGLAACVVPITIAAVVDLGVRPRLPAIGGAGALAAVAAGLAFQGDIGAPRGPRSTTLLAYVVWEAGLPAGVTIGALGLLYSWTRFAPLNVVPGPVLARHVIVGVALSSALAFLFSAFKARNERVRGAVLVDGPARVLAVAAAVYVACAALAIAALVVVRRELPPVAFADALLAAGGALLVTGALSAAAGCMLGMARSRTAVRR